MQAGLQSLPTWLPRHLELPPLPAPVTAYSLVAMLRGWRIVGLVLLLSLFQDCSPRARLPVPPPSTDAVVQTGIASWYGPGFHGKATSSGEIFDQRGMTAAHRTLPLGTVVEVTNRRNGRSVEVLINDRGPFVKGRIIDLSRGAAARLDMLGAGTAPVRVAVLSLPPNSTYAVRYAVQVGAFTQRRLATRLVSSLGFHFGDAYVAVAKAGQTTYFKVRVGPYSSRPKAEALAGRLAALGWPALVVEESSR